jgi:nitrous oxidase accessory protein
VILYTSASGNVFEGNSFLGYLTPLTLYGRHTDTRFEGNYWSDDAQPDLDGDGRRDRPYRLMSLFDHLRGNLIAADLLAQSPAASALALAEQTFPVLDPVEVVDPAPLARPPELSRVPGTGARPLRSHAVGIVSALGLVALGSIGLIAWRIPDRRGSPA